MISFSKTTTWLILFLIIFFLIAGFFTYQWWQVRGKLGKRIEQNEGLRKRVGELQKEIGELKITEEVTDETADWKTYRNERYGFEIDYPATAWEIEEKYFIGLLRLGLDILSKKSGESYLSFYIDSTTWVIPSPCEDLTWEEIMDKFYHCTGGGGIYTISPQKKSPQIRG